MTRTTSTPIINVLAPQASDLFAGFLDLGQNKLRADGQDIIITKVDSRQARMIYTEAGWKFQLADEDKNLFIAVGELADGAVKFVDQVTAFANTDPPGPAFDTSCQGLFDQLLKPALDKAQLTVGSAAAPTPPPVTPPTPPVNPGGSF